MITTAYAVQIDNMPVMTIAGSLLIDSAVGRRSTASFIAYTPSAITFEQYQQVSIFDQNNVLAFSGYIDIPKASKPGYQPSLLHTISCIDQHWLADKRIIAASYVGQTFSYIIQDIVNRILSQEGVTIGLVFDSLTSLPLDTDNPTLYPGGNVRTVPAATFVYCTVAAALDALAKEASSSGVPYYWQIDQYKALSFCPYTTIINSTLVDGTQIDRKYAPPTVTRQNPLYRNTQYIVGGVAQTLQQVETRSGDGNTTAWAMGYDLALAPNITVNGTSKVIAVKGSTGADFYWTPGDPVITQDNSAVKLVSTDLMRVVYIGQYPTVIATQDGAQINYMSALDQTTGIVEAVENDTTITSLTNGLSLASQLLQRYGVQGTVFVFTTLQSGFAQGQLISVNLPVFSLTNVQMLIEEVSAGDSIDNFNIWYTVTAILGPYDVTWVDFFSSLLKQNTPASAITAGLSQTLILYHSFNAVLDPTISLLPGVGTGSIIVSVPLPITVVTYACPVPATTLFPSQGLFPC